MSVLTTKPDGAWSNRPAFSNGPPADVPVILAARGSAGRAAGVGASCKIPFPCQESGSWPECPFAPPHSAARPPSHQRLSAEDERALFEEMRRVRQRLLDRSNDDRQRADLDLDERMRLSCRVCSIRRYLGQSYFKLAISVARSYARNFEEIDDLVSQACITLMRAVDLFDVRRGYRFSTYVTRAIRSELRRFVVHRRRRRVQTLDPARLIGQPYNCPRQAHPGPATYRALEQLLECLEPREVEVVRARFGLQDWPGSETLQSVADRLGVSRERVRQVEQKALNKLRHLARDSTASALCDALD